MVEIPARVAECVVPLPLANLRRKHLRLQHVSDVVPLHHNHAAWALDVQVHDHVVIGARDVREYPGEVLDLDVRCAELSHLHKLVGEAAKDEASMAVLMVVASVGGVGADHILPTRNRLRPNLQLDKVLLFRVHNRLKLHREEVVAEFVAISLVEVFVAVAGGEFLQFLGQRASREEGIAALDEALIVVPRLVLLQHLALLRRV